MFHAGPKGIAVGVVAVVLLPFAFLLWGVFFIMRHVYPISVTNRRAALVLRRRSPAHPPGWMARALLGPPRPEGKWHVVKHPDSR